MKNLFFIFIALCVTEGASAQGSAELSQLIQKSYTYFPKVKEAENLVSTANARLRAAEINLPNLDLNATYRYQQPRIEFPLGSQKLLAQPIHNVDVNLSASYVVLDFGRVKANVNRARQEIALANGTVEQAKQQLAAQVANIYYGIIYVKKALAVQDSVLAFYTQSRDLIQRRLDNGDAIRLDLLTVQSSLDQEKNRRADLQNQLDKQLNLLEYTTGEKTVASREFPAQNTLPDTAALSGDRASFIDLQLARLRIQQAEAEREAITRGNKPSVAVNAIAGPRNGFLPAVNELRFAYGAGVGLKLPLFDGQRTRRQLEINNTQIEQNRLALQSTEDLWRKDIRQAYIDMQTSVERIQNTAGQIEQARAAQAITSSRLQNGVATPLDLQNAATNVQRASLSRLQYEYQLGLSQTEFLRLTTGVR